MSISTYILDPEEDYEANYPEGSRPDPAGGSEIPVGRLHLMCSYGEMQEREENRRLSRYEIKSNVYPPQVDINLALKEFKRSVVGHQFSHSMDLRPWSVLRRALHHLLLDICRRDDDWMIICDFVFDRLRSIRQDMVIQQIEGRRYIEVLEGSVRFSVYSMYRLTCTLKDYTEEQPYKVLVPHSGPVKGLNNYEMNVVREMKLTMKCLRDCLSLLIVQYEKYAPDSPYRPHFEAISLMVNLPFLDGRVEFSTNYYNRQDVDPVFKIVYKMYREHLIGNHWSAMKHLPKLREYPLLVLAYAPALAQLQMYLVPILRKGYAATGANFASLNFLGALICPAWLSHDVEERYAFAQFIATQFGFFDEERNLCDFKMNLQKRSYQPTSFEELVIYERQRLEGKKGDDEDNETRHYAFQMIAGKDWPFYQETLNVYGIEAVLDPTQPEA